MRRSLLLPLLTAALAPAMAMEGVKDISVTFDVIGYASQEFSVGYFEDDWSSGNRYEINAMAQLEGDRVRPSGGVYFFYEDRDWAGDSQESAEYECWGFGLQGGATLHLIPPEKNLWLALVPYGRGGLGFQDFSARNVEIDGDRYNLSSSSGRIELAAGIDLRLTVAKRVEVVFGGGVDYWSGADVYLTAGTNNGGAYVGSNGTFTGTDAFVRFGAGVHF